MSLATGMGSTTELLDQVEYLRQQLVECQAEWLSPETYKTLMEEREETLHELAALQAKYDALIAQIDSLEPVAWMDKDGCLINDTTHPQNYTPLYTCPARGPIAGGPARTPCYAAFSTRR